MFNKLGSIDCFLCVVKYGGWHTFPIATLINYYFEKRPRPLVEEEEEKEEEEEE